MKTSTKRILSITLAVIFFLGVVTVYSSLIKPELANVGEQRALFASKEALFNSEKDAVAQVEQLLGEFQNLSQIQDTVSLALPLSANTTGALSQIQSIARLAGVSVGSFTVKPLAFAATKQPLVKRLGSLEIGLVVAGTYDNLKTFVRSLETNVRVANVASSRITPAGGDLLSLNLTVDVYYQE